MNLQAISQIILSVCLILAAGINAIGLGVVAWRVYVFHKFLERSSEKIDVATIPRLAEVIEKYQIGVVAMGEAQIAAIKDLESSVSQFRSLMFSSGDGKGVQQFDVDNANAEHEINELIRSGIPREGAEGRVKERRMYDSFSVTR